MVESRTGRSEGISPDDGTPSAAPGNWAARHDLITFLSTVIIVGLFEEVGWRGLCPSQAAASSRR